MNRLLEGEVEQIVMFRTHEDKKHGDVRSLSRTIPIEIDTDTHAVPVRASLEGRAVEADRLAIKSISIPCKLMLQSWSLRSRQFNTALTTLGLSSISFASCLAAEELS